MVTTINAQATTGLLTSADGSGIVKVQSDGKTVTALAWVNFNGVSTISIRASYNVTSVTRNATGDYTVNFTNSMSDSNYAISLAAGLLNEMPRTTINQSGGSSVEVVPTTSAFRFITNNGANTLQLDCKYIHVIVFGN